MPSGKSPLYGPVSFKSALALECWRQLMSGLSLRVSPRPWSVVTINVVFRVGQIAAQEQRSGDEHWKFHRILSKCSLGLLPR